MICVSIMKDNRPDGDVGVQLPLSTPTPTHDNPTLSCNNTQKTQIIYTELGK